MAENLCAHEPCACQVPLDAPFCGPLCQGQERRLADEDRPATRCLCGHPTCRPENVPPEQTAPPDAG